MQLRQVDAVPEQVAQGEAQFVHTKLMGTVAKGQVLTQVVPLRNGVGVAPKHDVH
jgi:hypothetical protein